MKHSLLLLVLVLAGCARSWKYDPAAPGLRSAIVYVEQKTNGDPRPLSWKADEPFDEHDLRPAQRVPNPAPVDVNSSIRIEVVKSALTLDSDDLPVPREGADLQKRRKALVALLAAVATHAQARQRALTALAALNKLNLPVKERLKTPEWTLYTQARDGYDETQDAMITAKQAAFPPGTAKGKLADDLWVADKTLGRLQTLIQSEIDEVTGAYRALAEGIRAKGITLRMEAFLESPKSTPMPVHLPDYDTLEQKSVQTYDRLGLAMTESQRRAFEEASAAASQIADAANRLKRGEISTRELFARLTNPRLKELAAAADDLASVAVKIRKGELQNQIKAALDEVGKFATQVSAATLARIKAEDKPAFEKALKDEAKAVLDVLTGPIEPGAAFGFVDLIRETRDVLASGDPARLIDLLPRLKDLLTALPKTDPEVLLEKVKESLEKLLAQLTDRMGGYLAELQKEWEASKASRDVRELIDLAKKILSAVRTVRDVVTLFQHPPMESHTRVPEGVDVPIDRARGTTLDLTRTNRTVGDTISVRATLLQDGKEIDTAQASFGVEEFGWHAALHPAVILAKPVRMEGVREEFAFAPVVSWLHKYTPRPEEGGWSWLNVIDPSFGPHAAFLNFFPDREFEVGLGLSMAFGGDVLVAGGGWNLFHDGKRNGDWYYFVGTNLIPILQGLQNLMTGSSGVKP